jgi:hypothetical protein
MKKKIGHVTILVKSYDDAIHLSKDSDTAIVFVEADTV